MKKKITPIAYPTTIEDWIRLVGTGRVSRRRFITQLTAAGASATALATLLAASRQLGHTSAAAQPAVPTTTEQQNLQLHDTHLARQQQRLQPPPASQQTSPANQPGSGRLHPHIEAQIESRVSAIMEDYHQDAVVEDMLVGAPLVGREAIANRKHAEFTGVTGATIQINRRFAYGDQVIAEWTASGTHTGDFWGFPATGRSFSIRGLTVVTRRDGKIVKESLYYDIEDMRRQLTRA
jgi:steroid delta-isomerase-like uncharacterized protein